MRKEKFVAIAEYHKNATAFVDDKGDSGDIDEGDWNFETYRIVEVGEDFEILDYTDFESNRIENINDELKRLNAIPQKIRDEFAKYPKMERYCLVMGKDYIRNPDGTISVATD